MGRRVINGFLDKYSRIRYEAGDVYESEDLTRLDFLTGKGYLAEETPPEPAVEEVGPDGDTGRRKKRAKNKPDADGL